MGDYAKLMMNEHAQARENFSFDPRVAFQNNMRFSSGNTIEAFNGGNQKGIVAIDPNDYTGQPEGSRADPQSVQTAPKTKGVKRYVIIDSSQRDWTTQPNPYTNLQYSFGLENTSTATRIVYSNNPFVPTFAVEQANNNPPVVGIPNTMGWTLAATPSNIKYLPYNTSKPLGQIVGVDNAFTTQASGKGFGSVFTPCNVTSIRLVRAVLPQRQFLSIPIDVSTSGVDASTSQFIQSTLVGKPYSTFTTYPYLLLYLNEYFGKYVGANEPMRRSFSVMTQKQRQQTNFQTDLGGQQYDYEPWGEEALQLQSPITILQKLAVTVTDPVGTNFIQNDNLNVSLIQATQNKMYLKCFTGSYQYFSSNELRIGDRVLFYSNTILAMLNSPLITTPGALNSQKKDFIIGISNATFPVLQLLDYVQNEDGIYIPRDASSARTLPYVSSYNGFMIPNFFTVQPDGSATPTLPGSIDSNTLNVLEPELLIGSNIPFLNTSLQPVFTLELESQEPDTGAIGGTIVL